MYSIFRKYFENNRISHAYILSGTGTDKDALADAIAAAVVCTGSNPPCGSCRHCRKAFDRIHPDIAIIEPEKDKTEIYVSQIRTLKSEAVVLPNEAERKAYIIRQADTMNPSAQNTLLKLLEEPPSHCCFILTAENSGSLLQTVRSRCIEMRMSETVQAHAENKQAEEFLDIFVGRNKESILAACFSMDKLNRNEFFQLAEDIKLLAMGRLRDIGASGNDVQLMSRLMEIIDILEKTGEYSVYNVGVGHTVGLLLAGLI